MNRNFSRSGRYMLYLCVWFTCLWVKSSQFPPEFHDKRFNIEAVPAQNGKILLHLKSRYGTTGTDGPMGEIGAPGTPGIPGLQGKQGSPGYCPVEICDAMQETQQLVSRVEALENLFKQRGFQLDVKNANPTEAPLLALHITSDIFLTKGNFSNGKVGIPDKIKVNVALKNAVHDITTGKHGEKFLVNSTVRLLDRSKVAETHKSGLARSPVFDGVSMTEQQFQTSRSGLQQEVPSIKKSQIPIVDP